VTATLDCCPLSRNGWVARHRRNRRRPPLEPITVQGPGLNARPWPAWPYRSGGSAKALFNSAVVLKDGRRFRGRSIKVPEKSVQEVCQFIIRHAGRGRLPASGMAKNLQELRFRHARLLPLFVGDAFLLPLQRMLLDLARGQVGLRLGIPTAGLLHSQRGLWLFPGCLPGAPHAYTCSDHKQQRADPPQRPRRTPRGRKRSRHLRSSFRAHPP
jgi:hypothetical protein